MEPVLEPLGFDWRMGVGIVAGVGAKELVVSTLGVMYADDEPVVTSIPSSVIPDSTSVISDSSSVIPDSDRESSQVTPAGDTRLQRALVRSVTPAAALAYMVFILLYFPCIATFVAIKNESGSWKWAIVTAVYTIALAWVAAFVTFRLFSLLL